MPVTDPLAEDVLHALDRRATRAVRPDVLRL
jgi:hypothetical protein